MKKLLTMTVAAVLFVGALTGCGQEAASEENSKAEAVESTSDAQTQEETATTQTDSAQTSGEENLGEFYVKAENGVLDLHNAGIMINIPESLSSVN
ncbi:hypothetical protein [Butyrivibrio sp. YAB3001]|uniref:hypothetical protein n=1 Tax=Butyrivibrio sp. YAB3001 TaxID=1520812 RepID=UPI0008F62D58|nr:hypothetical protein [Butyrivibrio sp. YAB3001]SFB99897.1 hypothetical protein SAMN02910398_01271 [Butyrivibrio sp. YAB3001]